LIDIDRLDQSYETAEIEAEVDFDAREQDLENLLHSGALTQGDLIDTIKAQQYDISSLKKENRFLKSKLLKAAEQGFEL
jgi:flagellar biosynthesis protein FlhG